MIRFLTAYLSVVLTILFLPLRLWPIRRTRLVFIGFGGGGQSEFACNPRYIYEALRADPNLRAGPDRQTEQRPDAGTGRPLEYVWIVSEPPRYPALQGQGVRLARHKTLRAAFYLLTAQVVISNGAYLAWFPFRRSQFVINTWHGGGAYKKLPADLASAGWADRRKIQVSNRNTDLFLSSSKAFTRFVIRGAFCYPGEVLEVGMPRNDRLVASAIPSAASAADCASVAARLREHYAISRDRFVVLYAPTFRDESHPIPEPLDGQRLLTALEARLGGSWLLLYRIHKLDRAPNLAATGPDQIRDASAWPDMQELLCLADVLITDYSSSIWDFTLTGKPCWLFVPDLRAYQARHGFYVDLPDWHMPFAEDNAALDRAIRQADLAEMREGARQHLADLQSTETGQAALIVASLIRDRCIDKTNASK